MIRPSFPKILPMGPITRAVGQIGANGLGKYVLDDFAETHEVGLLMDDIKNDATDFPNQIACRVSPSAEFR